MKYGEGDGTPLHYSCLENPMDGGAWWAAVHGVAKSPTRRSDFIFTFHLHALEKEMATHSSVLAWRIPGTGEPPGCHRWGHIVGHDWSDLAAAAAWSIFLNETGIFFFFTNAWQWTIQWRIAQFVSTALIPGKAPAILPTTDFPSTVQMAATQQKRQIESWYY